MGRLAVTIACLAIGLIAVGAYFSAVADDPCNDRYSGTPAAALFLSAVVFGVAAYFLAERRTSQRWIPMLALVATAVLVYLGLATIALIVFWIPQCAN